MFTAEEIAYLKSQRLARIATVAPSSLPDVAPVGYQFDGEAFLIGGHDITRTLKYRNVQRGNDRVALVVDDLPSVQPWMARGIKIHGRAEIVTGARGPLLRVTPERKWSWGIEQSALGTSGPVFARSAARSA